MHKCKLFIGCIGILLSWGMRNQVPMVWPLIRSECPRVRTLNLTRITPCSGRGNMRHGKNGRSLEMRQYYFSSCCHVSITCAFIRMKREQAIYHYLKGTPQRLLMPRRQSSYWPQGRVIYWESCLRLSSASHGGRSIGMPLFTYDYYWSSAQMTYQ